MHANLFFLKKLSKGILMMWMIVDLYSFLRHNRCRDCSILINVGASRNCRIIDVSTLRCLLIDIYVCACDLTIVMGTSTLLLKSKGLKH